MRLSLLIFTPICAAVSGWFLAPSHNSEREVSPPPESAARSSAPARSALSVPETRLGELGSYHIHQNGRRLYSGPRDVTLLERTSRIQPEDFSALAETMGQLSQMNDDELAAAWAAISQQAPRGGMGSVLLSTYALTRLRAAGIEVELPPAWAAAAKELTPAVEADEVRRDPAKFRGMLLAGDPLSSSQRQTLLRQIALESPAEAAQLWLENSTPEQLTLESQNLAFLMSDDQARANIFETLQQQIVDSAKRDAVFSTLLGEWAMKDRSQVERFIATSRDEALRDTAKLSLLEAHFEYSPEDALTYSSTLMGPLRDYAIARSISILGGHDATQAMDLMTTLTDPADRLAASRGLSYPLAKQNYEAFQKWRDQLAPAERIAANQEAFPFYAASEIESAVGWLNEQSDSPMKEQLKGDLMRVYAEQHPATTLTLLASFDDPIAKRDAAAIALSVTDPADLERVQQILTVANDPDSGVNLALPPGTIPSPLAAARGGPGTY